MTQRDEALELAALICDQMRAEQAQCESTAFGCFCLIQAADRIRHSKGYAELNAQPRVARAGA